MLTTDPASVTAVSADLNAQSPTKFHDLPAARYYVTYAGKRRRVYASQRNGVSFWYVVVGATREKLDPETLERLSQVRAK